MLNAINAEGLSEAFGQNKSFLTDATSNQFNRAGILQGLQGSIKDEDFNKLNILSQEIAYYEELATLKRENIEVEKLDEEIVKLESQNQQLEEKLRLEKEINREDVKQLAETEGIFTSGEKKTLNKIIGDSKRTLTKEQIKEVADIEEKAQKRINAVLENQYEVRQKLIEESELSADAADNEARKREKIFKEETDQANRQKAVSDVITGFSALIQVGTVLSGVVKTLNDETATTGEKLAQIATVMPSLIFGVVQLSSAIMANPMLFLGAAAIAGTIAAIAATANEISLLTDRNRVLNEQLKENKKAVEEATQAYDDLKSTLSNYSAGIEGLSKLKEGTLEFYEAIVKTNEEAQKLIDAFGLEAGSQYQIDSNGAIKINENALQQGMFKQSQELYQKQMQQSLTQYTIDQRERDKEIDKLTKQFQQNVSSKTPGGYGISYEQAKQMIDEFTLEENEVNISIGELQKALEDSNADNFEDLCTLITKEMSEVKATINEKNAQERQQAELIGSQAIRAYGNQDELEAYNKLPANLRKLANQTLGGDITTIQKIREENGLGGRNITSTAEKAIGLYGGTVGSVLK